MVINFHIGELVTSLQKATLIPGGSESLVYTYFFLLGLIMQFCYTSGGCGNQLPYRGSSDLPSEGHIDPWRFRVASLHLFFFYLA